VFLAGTLVMAGYSNEARPLIDRASRLAEEADLFSVSVVMPALALGYQWTEQYERAGRVITAVVAQSRQQGAVVALPFALAAKAEIELRVGNWTSAYAAAAESTALAEDTRQRAELSHSLARLAQVEACLGREADCRRHAERCIEICDELGIVAALMLAGWTLGLLELGGGRLDVAVEHLEPTGSKCTDHGLEQPAVIPWAQDLTEAHVRLDDWKPAQETLATLERQARRTRARVTRATAARCRALLTEDDDEAGRLFGRALALHDGRPAPFEHARTELCFGERLRRARRRSDAREHLRRALGTFERLGAAPWAERARRELAASGERARRRASDTRDELTAHELQVALVVAEGATNREAAAQLFVSPKTIETHLTHIYRKLGIRSRTELAHRLGADFERR
jgi:DNA-binding CsgD family transcriptional regulator